MRPKRLASICVILLFLHTSAFAQGTESTPSPVERSLWDHNGSVMYFVANGSAREIYYHKPRPGMLEAGAHPDSLLFKGQINDGHLSGTAYLFTAHCGQVPFAVKGPVPENGEKIVLTGQVPRLGRNCQAYSEYTSTLEFKLLKTAEVAQPEQPSATAQTRGIEESNPEPLARDVEEPKLPITETAQKPILAQRKFQPHELSEPKQAGGPSAHTSPTMSGPTVTQSFMDRNILPPLIIALNVMFTFLSILFLIWVLRGDPRSS